MKAVVNERREAVEFLIQNGADVKARTEYGWTALMWASSKGNEELVKRLVQAGADLSTVDKEARTALMLAEEAGHKSVADFLKSKGALAQAETKRGLKTRKDQLGHVRKIHEIVITKK